MLSRTTLIALESICTRSRSTNPIPASWAFACRISRSPTSFMDSSTLLMSVWLVCLATFWASSSCSGFRNPFCSKNCTIETRGNAIVSFRPFCAPKTTLEGPGARLL